MPLYEYSAKDQGCSYCLPVFTLLQDLAEPELSVCPECGAGVERVFSAPARMQTMATKRFSSRDLERKGFTQLKKVAPGVYEKTAGAGPRLWKV